MFQNNLHLLQKCYIDITVINNAKKNVICQGGLCINLQILSYYIIIKQEKKGKNNKKRKKQKKKMNNRMDFCMMRVNIFVILETTISKVIICQEY